MGEWNEPPAKRAKTQIKTVIRERPEPRPKAAKAGAKKASKPKAASRPKKQAASSSVPASERRRSGRSHKVSDYKERDDAADEEEMLDGVAEWEYGNDADSSDADRDPEASDDASDEEAAAEDGEDGEGDEDDEGSAEEEEEPAPSGRNSQKASAAKARVKPTVKASVLAQLEKSKKATQTRGRRGAKDSLEMDVDDDDE